MRPSHRSITPAVVHQQARQALQRGLDWQPFRASVTVAQLLDLLLLMAAKATSLFAACRRFFPFSHETARRAVHANVPEIQALTAGLVHCLYDVPRFGRRQRRKRWLAAIDLHYRGYYGKRTAGLVGGPKKQGTQWFFGYATAMLLDEQHRYTVALCPLRPKMTTEEVVRTLLAQIAAHGLQLRGVVLDSGFDSGDVLLLLQERRLPYTVPLRRKGSGRNARNRLFEGRHRQIRWAEWTTEKSHRPVRTRTLLWRGRPRTMLFAFGGCSPHRARHLHQQAERQRRWYRRRFGIETSYRQKNQALAQTTSKDPAYRLLLEGLAQLLRQVWVALTAELTRAHRLRPRIWVGALPLDRLLDWLTDELTAHYPEHCSIPLNTRT